VGVFTGNRSAVLEKKKLAITAKKGILALNGINYHLLVCAGRN